MTKEEVLQKVNNYCTEKQYTSATLTDAFKDKFATHFVKANADADINDENILKSLKFSLNTAFSSASELATVKATEFSTKENELKTQITELQKKITPDVQQVQTQLSDEVKNQLKELQAFKDEQSKQEKLRNIIALAKQEIHTDYHSSFDALMSDFVVDLNKGEKEQADAALAKFRAIFKDTIGDTRPKTPVQTQKQDSEYLASIPVIKVC